VDSIFNKRLDRVERHVPATWSMYAGAIRLGLGATLSRVSGCVAVSPRLAGCMSTAITASVSRSTACSDLPCTA
jgi:hypothetical protein